jgi:ribosomal protein S27E
MRRVWAWITCHYCRGKGAVYGTATTHSYTCQICGGTGRTPAR